LPVFAAVETNYSADTAAELSRFKSRPFGEAKNNASKTSTCHVQDPPPGSSVSSDA